MVDIVTPISPSPTPIQATTVSAPQTKVEKIKPKQPVEQPSDQKSKSYEETARQISSHLQRISDLKIRMDASTGRTFFQIVSQKGEVLMQVPSEEALAMARRIKEAEEKNEGLLLDKEG